MNDDHGRARELAAIALDFELEGAERTELDAHLGACDDCRAFAVALQRDAKELAGLPGIDAPERVRRAVLAGRRAAPGGTARPLFAVLVLAIVTLVPLGAGAVLIGGLGGGSAGATTAPLLSPRTSVPAVPTPSASPSPSPSGTAR